MKTFLKMTEPDLIPKWDMIYQGNESEPRDTSAAGIIANGLMELYDATGDETYKETAYKMLLTLYTDYSSKDDAAYEGPD